MPDSILVVEYEPRYIERVRQALSGYSKPNFAKDGEEAMNMLGSGSARLIVLSSIIPKVSTSELIRRIRAMAHHQMTPILITVSGYNGRSPRADAVKLGATDILPKPYSEGELLNKVKQLLESPAALAPEATIQIPKTSPPDSGSQPTVVVPKLAPTDVAANKTVEVPKVAPSDVAAQAGVRDDASGNRTDSSESKPAPRQSKSSAELDKLLETTLSGLQAPRKPAPSKMADARKSSADLDKLLETTLSGLDLSRPRPTVEKPAPLRSQPSAAAEAPPLPETTDQMPIPTVEELEAERKRAAAPPRPVTAAPAIRAVPVSLPVVHSSSFSAGEADLEAVDDGDWEEGGIRFGQYILLEKIATGGMAEVWKARMRGVEGFQKTVAIKKILPHMSDNEEFLTMFVDEAKLAAQLGHNNIIHIYELGKIDDSYFIAMEYIDGEDLKSIIKRGADTMQPMTIELALFVASKVAAALDYAHRKRGFDEKELGLVHRDVSPQNVLISHEGDIKLCDFGIAKAASKASHTMAGALKGKLQYMSPEQAWGRHIDRRSDIFALATVLFEILTGHKLFTGDSELSVLEQVREARVAAPSTYNDEVPPEVDAIVLKALAKNVEERYQTAADMARDLDEVLYTYRPTPTSADLAIHMHRLFMEAQSTAPMPVMDERAAFSEPEPEAFSPEPEAFAPEPEPVALVPPEPIAPPVLEPEPPPTAVEAAPVVAQPFMDSAGSADIEEEKKFPIVPVAIAAVVLIAAVGSGAFLLMGKKTEPAPTTAQLSPPPVTAPVATTPSEPLEPLATDTTTTDLVDPEATITDTALDQEAIDQEVQRRLDLERARLDARRQEDLKRAEEQSTRQQPDVEQTAPPPDAAPATQAPAETPPAAATPPPAAATPPPAAAAPPQQPAPAAVKEGDLVAVGTPGLVAPTLVKFNKPVYPPVAKLQRVEGIVIVQVLVSETGEVIDAKVLRGVPEDVGINEAALDAIKKSKFKPATKDGVKVKSHYTRTIPFKL